VIRNFGDAGTQDLWAGASNARVRRYPADIRERALRLLERLNAAGAVEDMRLPPANHLHKLSDDLVGFWAVSVTKKWRVIFRWTDGGPADVRLLDYH
jgi:proteic killer suppression protein